MITLLYIHNCAKFCSYWKTYAALNMTTSLVGLGKTGQSGRFVANLDNGAITCIPINNNE